MNVLWLKYAMKIEHHIRNCMVIQHFNLYRAASVGFLIIILTLSINSCSDQTAVKAFLTDIKKTPPQNRARVLDAFLQKNKKNALPLIDGNEVLFGLRMNTQKSVYLTGDMVQWEKDSLQMIHLAGTDFYYLQQKFPLDAYIEYKYVVGDSFIFDPFNDKRSEGGMGANSLLMMPRYEFPQEILKTQNVRTGQIDTLTFRSTVLNNERSVFIYEHPLTQKKAPLLIFQDGEEYLNFAYAHNILDNLIHEEKIPPVKAIFVNPVQRLKEYWMDDRYTKMLFTELIPTIKEQRKWNEAVSVGLCGVSLGGLISVYTLKTYPTVIDFVISQSGAFWVDNQKIIEVLQPLQNNEATVILQHGSFERQDGIHEAIMKLLKNRNFNVYEQRVHAGHNWGNWRTYLGDALEHVFVKRSL
ncbi:MAG: hypothetical protein GF313_14585 [Caldithrix sp.]|nr:hypothetical protein [Caldithrix sp.]